MIDYVPVTFVHPEKCAALQFDWILHSMGHTSETGPSNCRLTRQPLSPSRAGATAVMFAKNQFIPRHITEYIGFVLRHVLGRLLMDRTIMLYLLQYRSCVGFRLCRVWQPCLRKICLSLFVLRGRSHL